MKFFFLLFTVLLFVSACGGEPEVVPAITVPGATADQDRPEAIPAYDARTFFMTTSYGATDPSGFAFSADGSQVLVSSDESGVFNVRRFDLVSGESEALSDSDSNAVFAVSYFPADDRLL